MSVRERLADIRSRIERAAERSGRNPESVTLVAVTKIFSAAAIREAYEAGLREFGENYVQEFESKAPEVSDLTDARFHLIGHLQSNKARRAAELFQVIQTVDSLKLARRLDEAQGSIAGERPLDVMIEVKLSAEQAKAGADPQELPDELLALTAEKFAGDGANGAVLLESLHGAPRRVPADATAFTGRQARWNATFINVWLDPAEDDLLLIELHVGNAVHEQTADAIFALENGHSVAGSIELRGST